jgi:uncharacterized membrane protein
MVQIILSNAIENNRRFESVTYARAWWMTELKSFARSRSVMRWNMAAFYILAGIVHIAAPGKFLPIVPGWVPSPALVVLLTGVCEIAGGSALLIGRLQRLAGVMLALYAVCVFPANVKHAIEAIDLPPMPNTWWYHGPRLALQPVLVWWALFSAAVIDWPFHKPRARTRRTPHGD